MKLIRLPTFSVAVLLCACGVEQVELRPRATQGGPPVTEPTLTPAGQSLDNESAIPAAPVNPSEEIPVVDGIDMPPLGQEPPPLVTGCSKLDLLFVLDNSLSMFEAQSKVAAAFPALTAAIQEGVRVTDLNILVTDTDDWDGIGIQLGENDCEDTLGAGRRSDSDDDDCGIAGSLSHMTSTQPELEQTFACAADVGALGNFGERTLEAAIQAVSAPLNTPGACNAGFSRSDAVLVVVLVTDEDDTLSNGDVEDWRAELLAAKSGDEDAIVVLALVGDNNIDGGLLGGPCSLATADGAPELQRFSQLMPHRALGSVCAADYAPFFEQSAGVIDAACTAFVVPAP